MGFSSISMVVLSSSTCLSLLSPVHLFSLSFSHFSQLSVFPARLTEAIVTFTARFRRENSREPLFHSRISTTMSNGGTNGFLKPLKTPDISAPLFPSFHSFLTEKSWRASYRLSHAFSFPMPRMEIAELPLLMVRLLEPPETLPKFSVLSLND